MRSPVPTALTALAALALLAPGAASAAERTAHDARGRPIRFDVRAPGVNVADYARVLRNAVHGAEISDVVITIVPQARVSRLCGSDEAEACYSGRRGRGRITIGAGSGARMASTLLHEYGHHVDASYPHDGLPEPNGTPRWWKARRMAERLRAGLVAFDYRRGWSHAIGEIFAEDYVAMNIRSLDAIDWLPAPSAGVLRALRLDLTGRAAGPAPRPTPPEARPPLVVPFGGTLAPGQTIREPFGLLGTGRSIEVQATVTGDGTEPAQARARVACEGSALASADGSDGAPIAIDVPDAGPGRCTLTVTGVSGQARVSGTLTLTIGSASASKP